MRWADGPFCDSFPFKGDPEKSDLAENHLVKNIKCSSVSQAEGEALMSSVIPGAVQGMGEKDWGAACVCRRVGRRCD